jgi:uncharacterized protein YfkK (UPF0435 family)
MSIILHTQFNHTHLTQEEIKKLQKPITDKLDNITEFTQQILNSDKVKNVSKNTEANDVSESDHLLPLPKSPSAHTSISLDPNKDLNFDIIEKQFKFEKPSHSLSLDIRNRNAKIDTTIPEISTELKSLNAHITNAKKSQEQEKINNLQYVYVFTVKKI